MRNSGYLRHVVITLITALLPFSVSAETMGQFEQASIKAWRQFRQAQPFQMQIIGLTPQSDAIRTLIVTEPPPWLTWNNLSDILAPISRGCTTVEWPIMAGGSVTDVVCTLKDVQDAYFSERLAILQRKLYKTTQDAPIVALPVAPRKMMLHSLDLNYAATDLHRWLHASQTFRRNPLGQGMSFENLMAQGESGVFSNGQLVLWLLDRNRPIDKLAGQIRKFAVQADHVLGVVAGERTAAMVGRARQEPIAHMPPLRAETLLLLAGSTERNLAQSYERNDAIAGKGSDGIDRAPILLSPQLVDTEFGNLLNIADQLLKGWSMAGQVQYLHFKYPAPNAYPFGAMPASNVEKNRTSFLFNWNTDGAAYVQMIGNRLYIVPQRTGALPVIYGDIRDRPARMEKIAYDYFATSGDTTLARVQQYAFIYQAFRHLGITASAPAKARRFELFTSASTEVRKRAVMRLFDVSRTRETITALQRYWEVKVNLAAQEKSIAVPQGFLANRMDESLAILALLYGAQEKSQGELSQALAEILNVSALRRPLTEKEKAAANAAAGLIVDNLPPKFAKALLSDPHGLMQQTGLLPAMLEGANGWETLELREHTPDTWNHTAYVVRSRTIGMVASSTGGHNIDAPVTRFTEQAAIPKGTVSVARSAEGDWVVNYNPADGARLKEITRLVGTSKAKDKGAIEADVAKLLAQQSSVKPVSLESILAAKSPAAGFKPLGKTESAYEVRPLTAVERHQQIELESAGGGNSIVFEQLSSGGYALRRTGSPEVLEVSSITVATDALAEGLISLAGNTAPVSVLMKGIPDHKAEAMLAFVQSNLRRYNPNAMKHVLSSGDSIAPVTQRTRFMNARLSHNGMSVDHANVKMTTVTDGMYKGYTRVEVPVRVAAPQPLLLRIVFYIKNMGAAAKEVLVAKIGRILNTVGREVSPADVAVALREQLRGDFQELGIDAMIVGVGNKATERVHDVLIADVPKTGTAHS